MAATWLMPVPLDQIQKDLAARRGGSNPAVLGPQKINAWFDQVIAVTKQKLAAGE